MNYISENDRTCNCGCGKYIINAGLICMIEGLTNYIRKNYCKKAYPIFHSMTRCLKYNRKIGSKDTSTHTKGEAADLHYANFSICRLHEIASSVHYLGNILDGGLGYYEWGIHIDVARLRTWGNKFPFKKSRKGIVALLNLWRIE